MSSNNFTIYNISSFVITLLIAFVTWVILMNQSIWNGSLFPTYPVDDADKKNRTNVEIGLAIFLAVSSLIVWYFGIASNDNASTRSNSSSDTYDYPNRNFLI